MCHFLSSVDVTHTKVGDMGYNVLKHKWGPEPMPSIKSEKGDITVIMERCARQLQSLQVSCVIVPMNHKHRNKQATEGRRNSVVSQLIGL